MINEYFLRHPVLEIPGFMVFVVVGFLASRQLAPSIGTRWPAFVLITTIGAALIGVCGRRRRESPRPTVSGRPDGDAAANPGGLLAGVAFLRGVAWGHAGLPLPEDKLVRLLTGGLVVVALAAVAGALAIEPWRGQFLASALLNGLIFAGASLLALAFTRQAIAAGDVAAGWQRNPVWVITLLVVVGTLVAVSVAVSGQVKPTLELVVAALVAPLAVIGLIAGWTKRGLRIFVAILIGAVILGTLGSAIVQYQQQGSGRPTASARAGRLSIQRSPSALPAACWSSLCWSCSCSYGCGCAGCASTATTWSKSATSTAPKKRTTANAAGAGWDFARQPSDAVSAYRALLSDLADRNGVRREAWETPHEHAERLRRERQGALPLNLLAADYALAEFGAVELSQTENRRAVGRWRTLRRRLQATDESVEEPPPGTF